MKTLEEVIFMGRKPKITLEIYMDIFKLMKQGYSAQAAIDTLDLDYNSSYINHKYKIYPRYGLQSLIPNANNDTLLILSYKL